LTSDPDDQNQFALEDLESSVQIAKDAVRFLSDNSQSILPYLKLYISYFQVLSSFITFNVVWPSFLVNIMGWVKGTLFLDIVALPGLSCLWRGVSFQTRLISYTLGPLVAVVLLLAPVFVNIVLVKFVSESYEGHREKVISAAWKNVMFGLFLIYPIVSLSTMEAFNCQPIGLGKLAADFNEPCPEPTHFLRIWSYVFIAVYPVGIPLFCYFSMLTMGVHLVAQDIKFSLLLKSLILKYASLSPNSEEMSQLLEDCAEDIKLTKSLAVDILVKFETLKLEAKSLKELRKSRSEVEPGKEETKKSCICISCICGQKKSENMHKKSGICSLCVGDNPDKSENKQRETEDRIRKRFQKDSNENPRILSVLLVRLAKQLMHENTISIPSISWTEYREKVASKTEIRPVQSKESEGSSSLNCNGFDIKSVYAIHPDLEDDQEWGWWIKLQTSTGNLLMTMPQAWKTLNQRKGLGNKAFNRIGFLFTAYRVNFWYWEMLEMLRK
jgi:hypothetical protein